MSTTFNASLGDRGRLVVPAALRAQQNWEQGTPLMFIETEQGVILTTQTQALQLIRKQLLGESLVDALMNERRTAAAIEDAA